MAAMAMAYPIDHRDDGHDCGGGCCRQLRQRKSLYEEGGDRASPVEQGARPRAPPRRAAARRRGRVSAPARRRARLSSCSGK